MWGGHIFSILGSGLVQFALIRYLTKTTQSAVVLATASIVALLPQVLLGPFAGAIVDRGNRRWIMIAADGSIAAATLVLFALFFFGMIQPWHIYAVMFVRSLASSFHSGKTHHLSGILSCGLDAPEFFGYRLSTAR
ncbi:MAG TPA: MFS transporter [Bellilinea sp.]|nr:MFS transporter [Bellilinea sp.]